MVEKEGGEKVAEETGEGELVEEAKEERKEVMVVTTAMEDS